MKTKESGGPRGQDASKNAYSRKRHLIVDNEGSPITLRVRRADIQNRDGAVEVITDLLRVAPSVERLIADGSYRGPKLRNALTSKDIGELIEIIEEPSNIKEITVLNRR